MLDHRYFMNDRTEHRPVVLETWLNPLWAPIIVVEGKKFFTFAINLKKIQKMAFFGLLENPPRLCKYCPKY